MNNRPILSNDYSDIINLPHHQSTRYAHMSMHDRAAQFAPFAALTGYGEMIEDAGQSNANKEDTVISTFENIEIP